MQATAAHSAEGGLLVGDRGPLTAGLAAALGPGWTVWRSPGLPPALAGGSFARPLVYLAAARGRHGAPDVADASALLAAAARAGAPWIAVVASIGVHEPSPHHPGLVAEERWRPRRSGDTLAAAWLELEQVARATLPPERLLLLRAAPVPLPGADDPWSRKVFSRLAATPFGWDPMVQLLALEDLTAVLEAMLGARTTGTFHLAPAPAPARRTVRSSGAWRIALPTPVLSLLARLAGRPPAELRALMHPATVSSAALREATGLSPRWSTLQAARRNRGETPAAVAEPDPFGFDPVYRRRLGRTLFRFLYRWYWRVDTQGLEHVPEGRAVLVGVHRGFQPWDGVMLQQAIFDSTGGAEHTGRYVRYLQHPALVNMPVLAPYMTRIGGLPAAAENAAWVLENEGLLGLFPEGIRGAFSRYRSAYALTPFFRHEFAHLAIRHRAPIVPFVTVGTAETFPIVGRLDWEWWKRRTFWPFLPVTTPLPLPAKWHTRILEPVSVDAYAPADADDPAAVDSLAGDVRERLAAALVELLARRRSRFFGGLRPPGPP